MRFALLTWILSTVSLAGEADPQALDELVAAEGVSRTLLTASWYVRETEGSTSAAASRVRSVMEHIQHLEGVHETVVDDLVRLAWADDPTTGERLGQVIAYHNADDADRTSDACPFSMADAMSAKAGMTWVSIGTRRWDVRNQGRHAFEGMLRDCDLHSTADAFNAWRAMRRMTNIGAIGTFVPGIGLTITIIGAAVAGPTREEMLKRLRRGE